MFLLKLLSFDPEFHKLDWSG